MPHAVLTTPHTAERHVARQPACPTTHNKSMKASVWTRATCTLPCSEIANSMHDHMQLHCALFTCAAPALAAAGSTRLAGRHIQSCPVHAQLSARAIGGKPRAHVQTIACPFAQLKKGCKPWQRDTPIAHSNCKQCHPTTAIVAAAVPSLERMPSVVQPGSHCLSWSDRHLPEYPGTVETRHCVFATR